MESIKVAKVPGAGAPNVSLAEILDTAFTSDVDRPNLEPVSTGMMMVCCKDNYLP